ncbi:MAG: glycoside hydrolase family 3 protein, partial [Lachnospiraceae bacterium]|nr:glycoside hydrolase family 3 protein [Lachnospiraceae bacterium]
IDAVYFPHNIGIGAANDEELTYQMGKIVADETKQCHMLWNLYPCVAQSNDPRWGRNYECYSSDLETIKKLSVSYTKGLVDGGVMATAKHYFGDGNVSYGTGEKSDFARIIDRGDAKLTQEQINELLKVYKAQIDAGVKAVMVSYSSLNGLKMHENKEYIMKLRTDMGFKGIIMTDSMAIQNTSPKTYEEQVISAVNCGIDLFMEGIRYDDCRKAIVDAVNNKQIDKKTIDEAVTRIITVKKDMGLFDDPFCKNIKTVHEDVGSLESRAVAEKLVEKSLVLLKNEGNLLPLKKGTKVYVTGTTADHPRAQCGGWTMGWNTTPSKEIRGVTTILEAFERYAKDYGIEVITDPNEAASADVVLLCVGEDAYAEWYGDSKDLMLYNPDDDYFENGHMIDLARRLRKPTVTCIIAGRHLIMDELDYNKWDSVVMCYLPGSEGKGVSDVLCGCADFTGRLPEPWYASVDQIGTDKCLFERGYGLSYGDGFTPAKEPRAVLDVPAKKENKNDPMTGTNYKKGVFNKSFE